MNVNVHVRPCGRPSPRAGARLRPGVAAATRLAPNAITAPAQKTIGMPIARKYSTALIVLNARGAKLDGQKLTLDGVAPTAILFTSRPVRGGRPHAHAGHGRHLATGSFAKDPPNATVSVFHKDGSERLRLVVVT